MMRGFGNVVVFLSILIQITNKFSFTFALAKQPDCATKPSLKWWQKGLSYQIWTKSFQDSNGDGIGDINGLKSKLDQLATLNVQSIWPVPLLSSKSGSGYDVTNFKEVDGTLGTLDDLKDLIEELHKHNMTFIMDIPMTTVSKENVWWKNASSGTVAYHHDYFIWKHLEQTNHTLNPDDWHSTEIPNHYYRHAPKKEGYPLLNLRNPRVRESMKDVFKFWLDNEVDGFFLGSIIPYMDMHDADDIPSYFKEMAAFIRNYANRDILLFTTLHSRYSIASSKLFEYQKKLIMNGDLNYIINSQIADITSCRPNSCAALIYQQLNQANSFHVQNNWTWPKWELGHPYTSRVFSRMESREKGELMTMLLLVLPGSVNNYYGDELGMENLDPSKLPKSAKVMDYVRTPMCWASGQLAGFSTTTDVNTLPIPIASCNETINYEAQSSAGRSTLKMFQFLADIRTNEDTLLYGPMVLGHTDDLLAIHRRSVNDSPDYLCVLNFGNNDTTIDLTKEPFNVSMSKYSVSAVITTTNLGNRKGYKDGQPVDAGDLDMKAYEGILLKLSRNTKVC